MGIPSQILSSLMEAAGQAPPGGAPNIAAQPGAIEIAPGMWRPQGGDQVPVVPPAPQPGGIGAALRVLTAPPAAPLAAPPLPPRPIGVPTTKGRRGDSTVQKVTQKDMAPEERQAVDAGFGDAQAAVESQRRENAIRQQAAMDDADNAADAAASSTERAKHVGEVLDEGRRMWAAARARHDEAWERYRNADYQSFWADKSTGQKIAAGIGLLFGAIGGAVANRPNAALETINNAIKADFEHQRDRIARMRDDVLMARTGVADAAQARQDMLADLDLREAAATHATAAKIAASKARLGIPVAVEAGNRAVADLDAKAQELRARSFAPTARTIETTTTLTAVGRPAGAGGGGRAGGGLPPAPKGYGYVYDPSSPTHVQMGPDGRPVMIDAKMAQMQSEATRTRETEGTKAQIEGDKEARTEARNTDKQVRDMNAKRAAVDSALVEMKRTMDGGDAIKIKQAKAFAIRALHEYGKSARWSEPEMENATEAAGLGVRNYLPGWTPILGNGSDEIDTYRDRLRKENEAKTAELMAGSRSGAVPAAPASAVPRGRAPGPGFRRARVSGQAGWLNPSSGEFRTD